MLDKIDAIYLAHAMGLSPFMTHTAKCFLAARFGKTYFDSQKMRSK